MHTNNLLKLLIRTRNHCLLLILKSEYIITEMYKLRIVIVGDYTRSQIQNTEVVNIQLLSCLYVRIL